MSKTVHFVLSDEAWDVVGKRATPRKRGAWISDAIVRYDALQGGVAYQGDDGGILEQLEARMGRIEQILSAMLMESEKNG